MAGPLFRVTPNGERYRQMTTADDATPEVLREAESILDGWFADAERIDWEDFIDRLEKYLPQDVEIPEYDNPFVRKIQRHIRELRSQM